MSRFFLFCLVVIAALAFVSASPYSEWTADDVLMEQLQAPAASTGAAPPVPGALLPGQSCPVVGAAKKIAAKKAAPAPKLGAGRKVVSPKTAAAIKAQQQQPAAKTKAPKAAKAAKAPKAAGKKARAFLEMATFDAEAQTPAVPALTAAQLAKCAEDAKKAAMRGKGVGGKKFTSLVSGRTNDQIWAPTVNEKVKEAVLDYNNKKQLPNGRVYGDSVRKVSLTGKTAAQVEAALKPYNCSKEMQVIKEAVTNKPFLDANGKTAPMIVFICADGGAIRLKPNGDPSSKFRPQPHGSKALRHPYNSAFETFDDEIIKVDNSPQANPLPKTTKDLNAAAWFPNDVPAQYDAGDAWANRAHADLKK